MPAVAHISARARSRSPRPSEKGLFSTRLVLSPEFTLDDPLVSASVSRIGSESDLFCKFLPDSACAARILSSKMFISNRVCDVILQCSVIWALAEFLIVSRLLPHLIVSYLDLDPAKLMTHRLPNYVRQFEKLSRSARVWMGGCTCA